MNLNQFLIDMNEVCIMATQAIRRLIDSKVAVKDIAEHLNIADHWVCNVREWHTIKDPRMACKILINANRPFKPNIDEKIKRDAAVKPWDKLPKK
jgi:hypothetical protein